MALEVFLTPRAKTDLIDIWNYIAEDSGSAADHLLRRIDKVLSTLAENPFSGKARPELRPDIRSFPVGNYIMFYRVHTETIEVVRVRSRYMDVDVGDLES